MNASSFELVPEVPLRDEYMERFIRIYGSAEVAITPALDGQFRDRIAPGNHARVLLEDESDVIDAATLKKYVQDSSDTIEDLLGITTRVLAQTVKEAWSRVPADENVRSSGLLNTLCEARDIYRQRLQEIDGTEESGQTISDAIEDTASQVEDWLRTPGRYIMRPRRIKAKILSEQDTQEALDRLRQHPEDSPEWQQECSKLTESLYRLSQHIAVNEFLLQGKLPNVISVDDLANEAVEYTIQRIRSFDTERGIKLSSWVFKFMRHFYQRKIAELANPIQIPQNQLDTLTSSNPAVRIGNARIINEGVGGSACMRQAWLALGRNVLRLDGGDGPTDSDQFTIDPEGAEQNITWQELLTDYHRLRSSPDFSAALWPGHGRAEALTDPSIFAAQKDMTTILYEVMQDQLDARRQLVLKLRFGLDGYGQRTGTEAAKIIGGMGRARVHQLESNALGILRREFWLSRALKIYGGYELDDEGSDAQLGGYDPHRGQPNFPEYVNGESASEEVLESVNKSRRQRSGAVDPSLWEW